MFMRAAQLPLDIPKPKAPNPNSEPQPTASVGPEVDGEMFKEVAGGLRAV